MKHVTVQVRRDVAADVGRAVPRRPPSQQVHAALAALGLRLEAMHPQSPDPELATYFYVTVPDEHVAAEVCRRLQACEAVTAAFLKPPDAMPAG